MNFRKMLESDLPFESNINLLASPIELGKIQFEKNLSTEAGAESKQKGIFNKYLKYTRNYFLFVVIVAGLCIGVAVPDVKSIEFLQNTQSLLEFINHLKTRIIIAEVISQELLNNGNIALIENLPADQVLAALIEKMVDLRDELTTMFTSGSFYDMRIKNVLFDDVCTLFASRSYMKTFCPTINTKGVGTGLISLLNYYEGILNYRLTGFKNSDKSVQALRDIEAQDFAVIIVMYIVMADECKIISDLINSSFETHLDDANTQRCWTLFGFSIGFILLLLLLRKFVINRVLNANNQFKNVLKILPAEIILASFPLKLFLMKNSNGTLNNIKNYV